MADSFNPELSRTAERFAAWWQGEVLDRPPVALWTREPKPNTSEPPPEPADYANRGKDVYGTVDRAVARMVRTQFLGDTLPTFWANLGPVITSALWGAEMNFAPNTVWCDPIYHDVSRWHEFLKTPPNFGTFYWQIVEQMTEYALSIADGRFLVGITDLHGNYDILASLRGSEELCVDMIEEPQLVAAAAMHAARGFNEAFRRQWAQISPKQNVGTCWTPVYHPGPAFVPSCDFWCMVSPKMGRELVLPSIVEEMRLLERSIFHLDGPQALPQLDALLGLPNLNAVQWIYGAGQEPAGKWLDVYRKIVAAGKSAQVVADDGADALKVLDALGPKGLWFTINKPFESARAAREFLADFARRCARTPQGVSR